ncbi:MAG: IS66 family transposase [Acidobacteriota bacterium]
MILPNYVIQLKRERRILAIHNQQLQRSHLLQKQKADLLEEENTKLRQKITQLEKEQKNLAEELEKTKVERDTYKNLTFQGKRVCSSPFSHQKTGEKRGGKIGHTGRSRTVPKHIHSVVRVYLSNCPDCDSPVERVAGVTLHTVTDLPHWSLTKPFTTQYQIERQWCGNCHKEVKGVPTGVIPGSRLGSVFVTMVCAWKYRFFEPLPKIAERLSAEYGIDISEAGLQHILSRTKQFLGAKYDEFLADVRGSPVKHADETSWPVGPDEWWAWVFVDPKTTVYTIEESRGGGVAKDMLEEAIGILVRDDYKAYMAVSLLQQSCWAHLLRKSHEAATRDDASEEVKKLHYQLKTLFVLLAEDIAKPFDQGQREEWHNAYLSDLQKIINTVYVHADTKRIQTRIRNQGKNLLTALLYPEVPLTNNLAERAIMPLVLTRKISRGSKTPNGAKTHAVNLSIVETIVKRKQPLLETLHSYLLQGYTDKN